MVKARVKAVLKCLLNYTPAAPIAVLVSVEAVGVVLVLGGALVAEPGDGDDADEDAQDADADAEERELGRRVALVRPAVLVLEGRNAR